MSTRAPDVYFVAYDIANPGRLRAVYKLMRGFGDHMQLSVFRCVLSKVQLARMEQGLLGIIKQDQDQVLIIPVGGVESRTAWRAYSIGLPLIEPERVVKII